MGVVGCYTIHLYCDNQEHIDKPVHFGYQGDEYAGQTESDCLARAREDGWTFTRRKENHPESPGNGYALCPAHSGKKRKANQ